MELSVVRKKKKRKEKRRYHANATFIHDVFMFTSSADTKILGAIWKVEGTPG